MKGILIVFLNKASAISAYSLYHWQTFNTGFLFDSFSYRPDPQAKNFESCFDTDRILHDFPELADQNHLAQGRTCNGNPCCCARQTRASAVVSALATALWVAITRG